MNKSTKWKEELQAIADKYRVGDQLNNPFYKDMCTVYLQCKKATGRDPHGWLEHYNVGTYGNTGAIGWIDASTAIQAVVKKYEEKLARIVQQTREENTKEAVKLALQKMILEAWKCRFVTEDNIYVSQGDLISIGEEILSIIPEEKV